MYYRIIRYSFLYVLLNIIFSDCVHNSGKNKDGYPEEFNVSIDLSTEEPQVVSHRMEPLRAYLEKELSMPVHFFLSDGYSPVIEAMKTKKIDFIYTSPYPYLLARKKANAKALFYLGKCDGKPLIDYRSCIITLKSSGIKTMADLKAKCHGLKLAFVDPASTSGHIVPGYHLIQEGINPEKDFRSIIFTNNHLSAIFNLHAGKVDVACVEISDIDRVHSMNNQVTRGEFNYLWISGKIPDMVYCIRSDLNPAFINKVCKAYADVRKDSAACNCLKMNNKKRFSVTSIPFDSLCFLPADEKMYDDFYKIVQQMSDIAIK